MLVPSRQPRTAVLTSLAAHAVMLAWLLHGRAPNFVAPSSTRAGVNGAAVTRLYWAYRAPVGEPSAPARKRMPSFWRQPPQARPGGDTESAVPGPRRQAANRLAPGPSAGSPYGSLSAGPAGGEEIRPALPVFTAEPAVENRDLAPGTDGNVVIEITIDKAGNVVNEVVIASLGATVDAKVLAALEHWRFQPATRNGMPIASMQDVIYHFKAI